MQHIKSLDDSLYAITKEFESQNHSASLLLSDHINNVYCGLEDETAQEAVSILMDECDEIVDAAHLMKKRLNAYRKEGNR